MSILKGTSSGKHQKYALKCSEPLSSIYKFRPWLAKYGILRVGGMLTNAPIDHEAKHQILLPSNHHVSKLLIMDLVGHFGEEYVLISLRERYWIVKGRAMVLQIIRRCLMCRRYDAIWRQHMMVDLPEDRLTPDDPVALIFLVYVRGTGKKRLKALWILQQRNIQWTFHPQELPTWEKYGNVLCDQYERFSDAL